MSEKRTYCSLCGNVLKIKQNFCPLCSTTKINISLELYEKLNMDSLREKVQKESRAAKQIEIGKQEVLNGQCVDAVKSFKAATLINPHSIEAWKNLGLLLRDMNKFDKSIGAFEEILKNDPNNWFAWQNLGFIYNSTKELDKSINAFKEAIDIKPEMETSWNALGYLYISKEEYIESIKALKKALSINTEYSLAQRNLILAYYKSGDYLNAETETKDLINKEPQKAGLWYVFAKILYKRGNLKEALRNCVYCLEIMPDFPNALKLKEKLLNRI